MNLILFNLFITFYNDLINSIVTYSSCRSISSHNKIAKQYQRTAQYHKDTYDNNLYESEVHYQKHTRKYPFKVRGLKQAIRLWQVWKDVPKNAPSKKRTIKIYKRKWLTHRWGWNISEKILIWSDSKLPLLLVTGIQEI